MFLRRRLSPPLFTRRLCERPRVSLSASRGPSPSHQLAFAAAALTCLGGVWTIYRAALHAQPPPPPAPATRGLSQTHPLLLAGSGLDDEQKLQVALCRRQLWLRAAQFGPALAAAAYAAVALLQRAGLRLPRGSLYAAPLA
ncbi:hypothetical protein AB1Y20_004939 [Prymnesium parvum]|uniref:Uncharacterized protein n=1 Tax=Prymnesium parvum TaxID=97485 RepID=A0AB34J2N4_PRYPA